VLECHVTTLSISDKNHWSLLMSLLYPLHNSSLSLSHSACSECERACFDKLLLLTEEENWYTKVYKTALKIVRLNTLEALGTFLCFL
jgi:hypothetical protein